MDDTETMPNINATSVGGASQKSDVETDPATAAAFSLIAAAWTELAEEQEWLNSGWWS
jgi:hypothetical protein